MSVMLSIRKVRECPSCASTNFAPIEIVDKEYPSRNKIPEHIAQDICEDGVFEIMACPDCGFKWIKNQGMATTAQLKSWLLSFFIQKCSKLSIAQLQQYIRDEETLFNLIDLVNVGKAVKDNAMEWKATMLAEFDDALDNCTVDELVELYNLLSIDQIECGSEDVIVDD